MDRLPEQTLLIGDWRVDPLAGTLGKDDSTVRLEARTLRLLVYLAGRAGEVVGMEELLAQVWPDVVVTPDSVYQAITSLRRALADDPRRPAYIATVPRLGYRLIAPVKPLGEAAPADPPAPPAGPPSTPRARPYLLPAVLLALLLAVAAALQLYNPARPSPQAPSGIAPQRYSLVVLPFLDLTEGMNEEVFADGMTEQLIEMLGKQPELRVAARSLSFSYKGTGTPLAEVARTLNVAFVLEGSVRKSGKTLRVSAQLVRADSGFVVWTESYDRPVSDMLMIQDDIAAEVGAALKGPLQQSRP